MAQSNFVKKVLPTCLVVQGPPGTGKSQTITNLIATAVKEGKKVLFVAEKMAALDVVHGRMERLGLGAICLELHSSKANKKTVLEELARTLALGRPKSHVSQERNESLKAAIERLNRHAEVMNTPLVPSGLTPYQVIGRLAALYGRDVKATNLALTGLESWTSGQFRDRCRDIEDLQKHLEAIGSLENHPWRGVGRTNPILHSELHEFFEGLTEAVESLRVITDSGTALSEAMDLPANDESHLWDMQQLAQFASRLVKAPSMDRSRIGDSSWDGRSVEISKFLESGRDLAEDRYRSQWLMLKNLSDSVTRTGPPGVHPSRGVRRDHPIPREETGRLFTIISESIGWLREISEVAKQLEQSLRLEVRDAINLREINQLAQLALRLVKAPRMDRAHICHAAWESRRAEIVDLVAKLQALHVTRLGLEGVVADVAWQTDLSGVRRNLAGYGASPFRFFNGSYRQAVATLKGILKGELPHGLGERLSIVDSVISAQLNSRALDDDPTLTQLGGDAFGTEWRGSRSDREVLAAIVAWDGEFRAAGLSHAHRMTMTDADGARACQGPLSVLSTRLRPTFDRLKALLEPLEFDCKMAFNVDSIQSVPVRELIDRLCAWQERPESLGDWIAYQAAQRSLVGVGLGATGLAVHEGRVTVEVAMNDLQAKFHQDLAGELVELRTARPQREATSEERSSAGAAAQDLGRNAFGTEWRGIDSDWPALLAVANWDRECNEANLPWNHRRHLSRLTAMERVHDPLQSLSRLLRPASERLKRLYETVSLDVAETFGGRHLHRVPLRSLLSSLSRWRDDQEGLSKWIGYQMRRKRLESDGLSPLVTALHDGQIPVEAAVDQLHVSYYQVLILDAVRANPALAEFDGQSYEQWVAEFRALDLSKIDATRAEVATVHYDAIPRNSSGGEMAIIRREIEKKRRHKPIRQLLKEAGTSVLAIKPVFLMSPISVAQFLQPGSVTFDLLLIDEASQISPVDAFGVMARAKQIVVVGDDKQLPPTRFFGKMLDDEASKSDEDLNASDLESILGLCVAQGMSQRMLRWHYRSRHHSLIAVSNREFYDNHLYVVPSPTTITAMHGLHFHHVKDGVFDRGNSATNRVEAKAIAQAVILHAKNYPKKSLGVGAFSVSQRDAIRDELEQLQRDHIELASFFSPGRPESFFVKNLENIQGDERDVILISVGYGRDTSGYMAMNFGPLSSQGGERRLNVLISRARERCEVFSSITAEDIDLQRAKTRGAAAFKTFLRYAATGEMDTPQPTGGTYDSEFERQVARELESLGFEVHCQVGTAGFIIDLAIVDSARPGRYLLGIECDGATYHSSRSARDRDRLREAVLRDRGWRIHRVWSTDWFYRPKEQVQKIIAAIEKARFDDEADNIAEIEDVQEIEAAIDTIEITPIESSNGVADSWVCDYQEATLKVPVGTPIHETSLSILSQVVVEVIEIEGPVHREEVARRITTLWGLLRTGNRIAEAVTRAIEAAVRAGKVIDSSDFLSSALQSEVQVRSRASVASAGLRKPEMLPPEEIRTAVRRLVSDHIGLRQDELPQLVAKAMGFKSTSAKLKETIDQSIAPLTQNGSIVLRDSKLYLP